MLGQVQGGGVQPLPAGVDVVQSHQGGAERFRPGVDKRVGEGALSGPARPVDENDGRGADGGEAPDHGGHQHPSVFERIGGSPGSVR